MIDYKALTDKVLESKDFVTVLRESGNYNVRSFDEFVKIMRDFDERVKAKKIDTKLTFEKAEDGGGTLEWFVDQGYVNDKDRFLSVLSFNNGKIVCDKTKKFKTPGSVNINNVTDVNQLLKFIAGYLYQLERDDELKQQKYDEEDEEEKFELDPEITKILDNLKDVGETMIKYYENLPAVNIGGVDYKIEKGEILASTEQEAVVSLLFPRAQEMDIYANNDDGLLIRKTLLNYYTKNAYTKDRAPSFRKDMDGTPYFYAPIGKLPVKQLKGPEAKAMLNYYDGKNVRFQPKESD